MRQIYIPTTEPFARIVVHGTPVSVNVAYGHQQRHVYLSDKAIAWRDAVTRATLMWRDGHLDVCIPTSLLVLVSVWGVRGDCDNYLKLTLDGLKCAIGVDDRFYTPMADRVTGFIHAGAILTLWEHDAPPPAKATMGAPWDPRDLVAHRDAPDVSRRLGISLSRAHWLLLEREERDAIGPR